MQEKIEKNTGKIEYMESLKGIACLMVLFAHLMQFFTPYGMYVSGCGKLGVWFFMVSSGFLTIYPYEQSKDKSFSVKSYYTKRLCKIYPIYVFVLIISFVIGYIDSFRHLLLHLCFAEGIGHFWYMPVIVKMYLIMPVFILARKKIRNTSVYTAVLVLLAIILIILFPYWNYEENAIRLYWYIPVFMLGILLASIYHKLDNKKMILGDFLVILSFLILLVITPFFRKLIWHMEPSKYLQNKYVYVGFLWCFIILGCEIGLYSKKILEKCKLLKYIGKISYPLYLIHYVIFSFVNSFQLSMAVKILVGLLITFIICIAFDKILIIIKEKRIKKI